MRNAQRLCSGIPFVFEEAFEFVLAFFAVKLGDFYSSCDCNSLALSKVALRRFFVGCATAVEFFLADVGDAVFPHHLIPDLHR